MPVHILTAVPLSPICCWVDMIEGVWKPDESLNGICLARACNLFVSNSTCLQTSVLCIRVWVFLSSNWCTGITRFNSTIDALTFSSPSSIMPGEVAVVANTAHVKDDRRSASSNHYTSVIPCEYVICA